MASTVYETEISLSATRYNLGLKQDLLERNIEGYEQDFEIVNREFIHSLGRVQSHLNFEKLRWHLNHLWS